MHLSWEYARGSAEVALWDSLLQRHIEIAYAARGEVKCVYMSASSC